MLSRWVLSIAAVMSVSAVALADMPMIIVAPSPPGIVQGQNFCVGSLLFPLWGPGMSNIIVLDGGAQNADGSNILYVTNKQGVGGNGACSCGPYADNYQFGSFTQIGKAVGECAVVKIEQDLASVGDQWQVVGNGCALKAQGNELGLAIFQTISRAEGPGGGNAQQIAVLYTSQGAGNIVGPMDQSSDIVATQNAKVSGEPCSEGSATSTLVVSTSQFQLVN